MSDDAASYYDATEHNGDSAPDGERRLWMAVLTLAIQDATTGSHRTTPLERDRTRTWFKRNGEDFRTVCHLAGMDPDFIREQVLDQIENGPRVRTPAPKIKRTSFEDRLVEYQGRTQTIKAWCAELSLNREIVYSRFYQKWSVERAFTTPIRQVTRPGASKLSPERQGPADPPRATSDLNTVSENGDFESAAA